MALMLGMGAFMSFFTFATPLLVHYVSKKYVTEMYYNKMTDTYTAITYSLFLRKIQVTVLFATLLLPHLPHHTRDKISRSSSDRATCKCPTSPACSRRSRRATSPSSWTPHSSTPSNTTAKSWATKSLSPRPWGTYDYQWWYACSIWKNVLFRTPPVLCKISWNRPKNST